MCPCISSKIKYAICNRYDSGLMCPSIIERENFCFSLYELCPLFLDIPVHKEGTKGTISIEHEDMAYV